MMMTPNLHLAGQCEAAIDLYRRAFAAEVSFLLRYREAKDPHYGPEHDRLIYHAELRIGGLRLVMSDSLAPVAPPGNTVSIMLSMDAQEQAAEAFGVMAEGATILTPPCATPYSSFFASLIDRFGVRWELIVEI